MKPDTIRDIIMNSYDIRHLSKRCNYPQCKEKPTVGVEFFEFTLQRSIGIANLYLCKDHIGTTARLMKTIRQQFPDSPIQSKQTTIA